MSEYVSIPLRRPYFLKQSLLTYPISNTQGRDLLVFHRSEESTVEILLGGVGDINHIISTVNFNVENEVKVHFHLNDNQVCVIARDFLILSLMSIKKIDTVFILSIWANQGITKDQHLLLKLFIKELISHFKGDSHSFSWEGEEVILKKNFHFPRKGDLEKVLCILQLWCDMDLPYSELQLKRKEFITNYAIGMKKIFSNAPFSTVASQILLKLSYVDGMGRQIDFQPFNQQEKAHKYIRHGVLPFEGCSKELPEYANVTFFPISKEYHVHPSTVPYLEFSFGRTKAKSFFGYFNNLVKSMRIKFNDLSFSFYPGDIVECFDNYFVPSKKQFNLICTSNICDNIQPLNLMIATRKSLKDENSYLELESMKINASRILGGSWRVKELDPKEVFYRSVIPFPISLLHVMLGMELAFGFGDTTHFEQLCDPALVRMYFQKSQPQHSSPILLSFLEKKDRVMELLMKLLDSILRTHACENKELKVDVSMYVSTLCKDLSCEFFFRVLSFFSNENELCRLKLKEVKTLLKMLLGLEKNQFIEKDILELYHYQLETLVMWHFPRIYGVLFPDRPLHMKKCQIPIQRTFDGIGTPGLLFESSPKEKRPFCFDCFEIDHESVLLNVSSFSFERLCSMSAFVSAFPKFGGVVRRFSSEVLLSEDLAEDFAVDDTEGVSNLGKQEFKFYEKTENMIFVLSNIPENVLKRKLCVKFYEGSQFCVCIGNSGRFVSKNKIRIPFAFEKSATIKKSRTMNKLFVIIKKRHEYVWERNFEHLKLEFESLPDWKVDEITIQKFQKKLRIVCFTYEEKIQSRDRTPGWINNAGDALLRRSAFRMLRSALTLISENHKSGKNIVFSNYNFRQREERVFIALRQMKIVDESHIKTLQGLENYSDEWFFKFPVFEVFYCSTTEGEDSKMDDCMEQLCRFQYAKLSASGTDLVVFSASCEEQKALIKVFQRNRRLYYFQREYPKELEEKLFHRSVIRPIFPSSYPKKKQEPLSSTLQSLEVGCARCKKVAMDDRDRLSVKFCVCKKVVYCSNYCMLADRENHKKVCHI